MRLGLWLALILALLGAGTAGAQEGTERFSATDLTNGKTVGEDACNATSAAVWIASVAGGPACLRYYFSDVGGHKPKALVFLTADFTLAGTNGRAQAPADYAQRSPASLVAEAEGLSRRYGGPVMILARPGTYGSSGREVMESGTRREIELINAALDAIRDRHGLDGFHLAGLGEGGNIAATLGVRRADVGCLVAGSSPLSRLDYLILTQQSIDPIMASRLNDPVRALAGFRPRKGLHVILLSETGDRAVPERAVAAYIAAAHQVGLALAHATMPMSGPDERARRIVEVGIRCGLGESDRAIFTALAQQIAARQVRETTSPEVPSDAVPPPPIRSQKQVPSVEAQEALPPSFTPPSSEPQEAAPFEPGHPPAESDAAQEPPMPQERAQLPPEPPRPVPPQPGKPQRQADLPPTPPPSPLPAPNQARTPSPAQDKFSRADVLAGLSIDEATCLATPYTVWVTNVGSPECIRYYYSAVGGVGGRALLFMNGDFTYRGADGQPTVDASYDDIGPKDMQRIADVRSRDYGGPMVYLARPGTLGSSGNELKLRHTPREVALVTAAIVEIKRRHLISTFDVVGQSGGGLLLGALVATRNDIGCAISASGVLATNDWVSGRLQVKATRDGTLYDPVDHIADIRPGPDFRFFVLTDAQDERVPPQSTEAYLKALAAQGIPYRQIRLSSPDPAHHDLALHGIRAAIACAHGALDSEIASLLAKTVVTQRHMSEMSPIGEMPKAGTLAPGRPPVQPQTEPRRQIAPEPQRRQEAPLPRGGSVQQNGFQPSTEAEPPVWPQPLQMPSFEPQSSPGRTPAEPIGHGGRELQPAPTLWLERGPQPLPVARERAA